MITPESRLGDYSKFIRSNTTGGKMKTSSQRILGTLARSLRSPAEGIGDIRTAWRRIFPRDPEAIRIAAWRYGRLDRVPLTEIFPGIERVEVTVARAYDRKTGTSMDVEEVLTLASIAKYTQARNILEIGTYDGNTTLNLALNATSDAKVTTVDLPPDWNGSLGLEVPGQLVNVTDRAGIGRQFLDSGHAGRIVQVFGDSAKLDWSALGPPFDLVFIDGCHAYSYVKSDTENACTHLRPGGIIVWHDYGMYEDVSRYIDEVSGRLKSRSIRGTRLAVGFAD